MRKIVLFSSCLLLSLGLVGCSSSSNQSSKSGAATSKKSSNVVAKHRHHQKHRKHKSDNKGQQKQTGQNQSTTAQSNNENNQTNQAKQAKSSNGLPPAANLSDFVNRYGVSPALWKEQHGMSAEDALNSTPEDMRTSGENQDVTGIQQGYIDPNTLNYNGN